MEALPYILLKRSLGDVPQVLLRLFFACFCIRCREHRLFCLSAVNNSAYSPGYYKSNPLIYGYYHKTFYASFSVECQQVKHLKKQKAEHRKSQSFFAEFLNQSVVYECIVYSAKQKIKCFERNYEKRIENKYFSRYCHIQCSYY